MVSTTLRDASSDTDTEPDFRRQTFIPHRRVNAITSHVYKVFDSFIIYTYTKLVATPLRDASSDTDTHPHIRRLRNYSSGDTDTQP